VDTGTISRRRSIHVDKRKTFPRLRESVSASLLSESPTPSTAWNFVILMLGIRSVAKYILGCGCLGDVSQIRLDEMMGIDGHQ
jgi:hypothetical protein